MALQQRLKMAKIIRHDEIPKVVRSIPTADISMLTRDDIANGRMTAEQKEAVDAKQALFVKNFHKRASAIPIPDYVPANSSSYSDINVKDIVISGVMLPLYFPMISIPVALLSVGGITWFLISRKKRNNKPVL